MKKFNKSLFLLVIISCPFVFAACEKDEGTTSYNDVDDDDWKKAMVIDNNYDGNDATIVHYNIEK